MRSHAALLCLVLAPLAWGEQKAIHRVKLMPNAPSPYRMRDWNKVGRDYDAFVFNFNAKGTFLPLIRLDREHPNYAGDSFALVSYVSADVRKTSGEGINNLAAVVSATLSGIDKSRQNGHNFVAMCQKWFNSANGENVYLNSPSGRTGGTFWYELLPNILAFQLNALYPGTGDLPKQVMTVADRYHEVTVALGGRSQPPSLPDFSHLSFSFQKMQPTDNGRWKEPDAAAAVAWLEYMAWLQARNPKYLTAADWSIRYLTAREKNPLYEILLPYGALAAARMNAEEGKSYDVAKLINWCFDGDAEFRRGWGIIADNWSGLDAHGLVGSITDGDGYGFAMNTFQMAGALTPIVRYDDGWAHDIGKWVLNLANASRLYYWNAFGPEKQSNYEWASMHDKNAVIAYEGIRKWKRGAALARSDYRTARGRIAAGNYQSTHFRGERPLQTEVLEEVSSGQGVALEHIWDFDLPTSEARWLVVQSERTDTRSNNAFQFSYATNPDGPYRPAFTLAGPSRRAQVFSLPAALKGKLYLKVASTDTAAGRPPEQLSIDAMAISYRSDVGPFAQGDAVVSFIDLIDQHTVPIVLYRPASVTTDLGLYGSSHAGILGGMVRTTNVEKILQLDLLKADYYHGKAYPTFLYYNPHTAPRAVEVDVGSGRKDLYDAVGNKFLAKNVTGRTKFTISSDAAVVVVLVPAEGKQTREGKKLLIDGVVVDYSG